MTTNLYLSTRAGGASRNMAAEAVLLEGDGTAAALALKPVQPTRIAGRVAGRVLVLAVHGFNVGFESGVRSFALLQKALEARLPGRYLMVGVLWPGDFIVPAINYPGEWRDAVDSGRLVAAHCNRYFGEAADICFLSHSLGGRLTLEAVANLDRPAGGVCLTASATDDDCLEEPYDASVANSRRMTYLASRKDLVLRLAYPIGDWAGDVFLGDRDNAFRGALGRNGAKWPRTKKKTVDGLILDDRLKYDHGNYFPSGKAGDAASASSLAVASFAATFFEEGRAIWPPPP